MTLSKEAETILQLWEHFSMKDLAAVVAMELRESPSALKDVLLLTSLVSVILVPATLVRPVYSFSVGYAFSVAFVASAVLATFPPQDWITRPEGWLMVIAILYGLRLGIYIFLRDVLKWHKFDASAMAKMSIRARLLLALCCALLYGLMTLPLLTTARRDPNTSIVTCIGTTVAWIGAVLEAIADLHKHRVKQRARKNPKKSHGPFTGPVQGLYRITRHPNYSAEIIFWMGIWIAGIPSYGDVVTWASATLGFVLLVAIMFFDGTPRLERQQQTRYAGIKEYEEWKGRVKYALVPGIY